MLAKGVADIEGSIFMTNSTPIKLEIATVRRANSREKSHLLLVDRKLLDDSNQFCVLASVDQSLF